MRPNLDSNTTVEEALNELQNYVRHSSQKKFRGKSRALQALQIIRKELREKEEKCES